MATTFDYNGPPVNVTNGMAIKLVSQFGVKNAWFAFLKLRGMKTINTIEGENEQKAYAYFRNKIGNLRQQINAQEDEQPAIIDEDFDNFLTSLDTLEIREDAPEYAGIEENELIDTNANQSGEIGVPTTASLLQVIEQNKSKKNVTTTQKDVSTSAEHAKGGKMKNSRDKEDDPETKQVVEKLLAAKEEIARRHAETIDDVVSLVMEKIRNNQPFEGELALGPTSPPKSHHKRAGTGISGQRVQKGGQKKDDQPPEVSHQMQSMAQFHPAENGAAGPTGSVMAQANAFGQLPSGHIVLLHNPTTGPVQIPQYSLGPSGGKMHSSGAGSTVIHQPIQSGINHSADQFTILGNYTDINTSTAPNSFQPISGHYPKSSQQQIIGHIIEPNGGGGESDARTTTTAIPIDLAIQKNMTIQELIQTLKVQSRHQNAQIILHNNAISTTNVPQDHQQETPDSSSQDATAHEIQKPTIENQRENKKAVTEKKSRKRKAEPDVNEGRITQPSNKQTAFQKKISEKLEPTNAVDIADAEKKRSKSKANKAATTIIADDEKPLNNNSLTTTSTTKNTTEQKQKQQISDFESQLSKINKQLTAEKNKSTSLKKRLDKLQSELDKSQDSIQLLQIDLACQKTDNNNLIAENIALKAENQQLRSKGQRVAAGTISGTSNQVQPAVSSSSSHENGRGRKKKSVEHEMPKAKAGRGRRPREISDEKSQTTSPEQLTPPFTLSSELGRRQSKRICVTRNQYMKNLF